MGENCCAALCLRGLKQLFANLGDSFLQSILKMAFYLCGLKCRSSSDPVLCNSRGFHVAFQPRRRADLLNKTLKRNYEPSKHDLTKSQ